MHVSSPSCADISSNLLCFNDCSMILARLARISTTFALSLYIRSRAWISHHLSEQITFRGAVGMGSREVVSGTMHRIYLGICSQDLRITVLLVIFWIPVFLQAAPITLQPDWTVTNIKPNSSEQQYCANNLCFINVIPSEGSFYFGFARTTEGLSTLAIALIQYGSDGNPIVEVVWSANRNSPVKDNATLSLSVGNLVLHDSDKSVVWSTKLPPGKNITSIEILNSTNNQTLTLPNGNLVMRDAENQSLWESFSYPTDTLIPGQMLTYKSSLVAGLSPTNPSEGSYKMVVESAVLVLYTTLSSSSGPQPYWMSTERAISLDTLLRSPASNTTVHIDAIIDANEHRYGTLTVCIEEQCPDSDYFDLGGPQLPLYNFLRLDYDGVLRWYYFDDTATSWVQLTIMGNISTNACLYPSSCGPYGICSDNGANTVAKCTCPSGELGENPIFQYRNASNVQEGCMPEWNMTSCANGHTMENSTVDLLQVQDVIYFVNQYLEAALLSGSTEECKALCLKNCSCAASFFWSNSTLSKCFLASQQLLSMYTTSSLSPDELPETGGQYLAFIKYIRKRDDLRSGLSAWKLSVGVSSGGLLLLSVCICVVILVLHARSVEEKEVESLESLPGAPPKIFSFKELDTATKHFNKILGEGGFGIVYEGILPNGRNVAVKRLGGSRQGQKEFSTEVETMALNHLHLVHLWGFCSEGDHRMLVYECMNNGSLDRWLFREAFLDWKTRYQIAVDTAKGLSYLHQDCRHRIIHLDVKPQNILLDDQFRAKVADFGMSKLFDGKKSEVMTNMRGTRGYLAPEWLKQAGISVKCDVYSYGMVLLEIVSGRKNMDVHASLERCYFPAWVVRRMQDQTWDEVLDVGLQRFMVLEDWAQVKKVVKIAMWCIQDSPQVRPTMAAVVQMLEGAVEVDDPPLQFDFLANGVEY